MEDISDTESEISVTSHDDDVISAETDERISSASKPKLSFGINAILGKDETKTPEKSVGRNVVTPLLTSPQRKDDLTAFPYPLLLCGAGHGVLGPRGLLSPGAQQFLAENQGVIKVILD